MANIKQQKKRMLTNEKRHQRNVQVKSMLKTEVRKVREAVAAGDKKAAQEQFLVASKALDKAAGRGFIHKNQAAERKSKLAKAVNSL